MPRPWLSRWMSELPGQSGRSSASFLWQLRVPDADLDRLQRRHAALAFFAVAHVTLLRKRNIISAPAKTIAATMLRA